jgi:WD40 repeat protein
VLGLAGALGLVAALAGWAYHTRRLSAANGELTAALGELGQSERELRRRAYADGVRRAAELLEFHDQAGARRRLDEWLPQPGREDLRGFEWYYLDRQFNRPTPRLGETGDRPVVSLAYSPDGTLAAAGEDGRLRFWDPATGEVRSSLDHPGDLDQVAVSPDGRWFASACHDGRVRVGRPGGRVWELTGHSKRVHAVAFQPGRPALASAGSDGEVRLWDLAADPPTGRLLLRQPRQLYSLAFTPEGRVLAACGEGQEIALIRVETGRVYADVAYPSGNVHTVRLAPDGRVLAAGAKDGTACFWDLADGPDGPVPREGAPPIHRLSRVNDMAFSPDGRSVALALDGAAEVWEVPTLRRRCALRGPAGRVGAVAFSPDGRTLATGGPDGGARLWDLGAAYVEQDSSPVGDMIIRSALTPSGRLHLVRYVNGTVRLEVHARGSMLGHQAVMPGEGTVTEASGWCFSSDGTILAACSRSGEVLVWTVSEDPHGAGGEWCRRFVFPEPGPPRVPDGLPQLCGLGIDGPLLAVADKRSVRICDSATGRVLTTLTGQAGPPQCVAFGRTGAFALSTIASGARGVYIWDLRNGELRTLLSGAKERCLALAFSPDGRTLAGGLEDRTIRLWDWVSGAEKARLVGHRAAVGAIAFSPDGRTLASGSADGTARLWHVATGREMLKWATHEGDIQNVVFSLDGRFLAATDSRTQRPGSGRFTLRDCGRALTGAAPPD